jgi:hypothetical protein
MEGTRIQKLYQFNKRDDRLSAGRAKFRWFDDAELDTKTLE